MIFLAKALTHEAAFLDVVGSLAYKTYFCQGKAHGWPFLMKDKQESMWPGPALFGRQQGKVSSSKEPVPGKGCPYEKGCSCA